MTDNVIPLRGGAPTVLHSTTEPAAGESGEHVTDLSISPEKAQLAMSIVEAADFLVQNREKIRYFLLGVGLEPPADMPPMEVAFHIHTSPITLADFALSLKLLDKGLTEGL